MSNGFWGNMRISCFFIATFHQIAVYSLCLGPSWILIHLMLKFIVVFAITIPFLNSYFKTSHVKVYPTHFLHFIQSTISDFSVFINILKFFTSRRALCQKNSQNRCNATVFADSRNFTLIGGW